VGGYGVATIVGGTQVIGGAILGTAGAAAALSKVRGGNTVEDGSVQAGETQDEKEESETSDEEEETQRSDEEE
jgi:hypothetical protein